MPIYTRTGDKGTTSLFDKTRVLKSNVRVETYGTIDELNSNIGFVRALLSSKHQILSAELEKIQHDLFDIGSTLANPQPASIPGLENRPKDFEEIIDKVTVEMPELKNFILPGGSKAGAFLHICRTITRRAERQLVRLMQEGEIDETIVIYFNRLSDLFFTLARYINYKEKKKETKWIKRG